MEKFGIKNVDAKKMYEKQEKPVEKQQEVVKKTVPEEPEENFLFAKKYDCPVCNTSITSLTVKSSKVRMIGSDMDLRPKYQQMDATKYDIVMCPKCGYANTAKNFPMVMPAHKKMIIDNISKTFNYKDPQSTFYSYDEAIMRYKLALTNAMVKNSKDSEKAYICLKLAWVIRGKAESLDSSSASYKDDLEECKVDEQGALQLAKDGFINARASEDFPIAGMDEPTVDYLISALCVELDDPKTAAKLLSNIIVSKTASSRVKDRARDLMAKVKKMLEEAEEE